MSDDEDDERLARAFKVQENWVNDFIKRLNGTIEDIVQKNEPHADHSVGGPQATHREFDLSVR